jgi:uncharacterized protein
MNRLAQETSPYLLQHKNNPVDWYPWGEEAFAKAREEDKPLFLSIGYSACHWCHVMERESFENESIAAILNAGFVSIKVDREERPDVDSIYMQAVQMMTGHGGWPMSTFLTPDGRPFFAGTYFPPDDRQGMPGFPRVLEHVLNIYRTRRSDVEEAANEVTTAISTSLAVPPATGGVTREALNQAAERIASSYDTVNGGFGGAPKFPPSMSLEFLMQIAARTGSTWAHDIVVNTLVKMGRGGMYDQLGGGFHRYSVDAKWLVPHFEKMLYDNALLTRLYTRAWQWTKHDWLGHIAREILGYVMREMTSPEGGFYSTLDADSEGEEGKFYVWSSEELVEHLGAEDARIFSAMFDVTPGGNFEGHNILNLPRDPDEVATELGVDLATVRDVASRAKSKLYAIRSERVWPARDEKVLAGWNGWMLAAFAEAATAFDRADYMKVVRDNADFLINTMIGADGRLCRSYKDGRARIDGLLEDYAGVSWGLVSAFEATHDRRYLDVAKRLMDDVIERFSDDEHGGFFDTATDHEALITRPKDLFDNATPSSNSVACDVLLRLGVLFDREDYTQRAVRAIEAAFPLAERYPSAFGHFLGAAEWLIATPKEIVITGDVESDEFDALERVVGETYLPHRVFVAGSETRDLPLMRERPHDEVKAYVCEHYACSAPTEGAETLRALLASEKLATS